MTKRAVIDAGPLIAIVQETDEHHARCVAALRRSRKPLLTCWPVITEAAWLVRNDQIARKALFEVVQSPAIHVADLTSSAIPVIASFLEQYASIRAQVADAALMYLAEREGIDTVFTLDRRDFSVYRTSTGKALHLIPE